MINKKSNGNFSKYEYDASVIIPVFNSAPYIETAIRSVMMQDYAFEKIQVILIDNNSTDDSKNEALHYSSVYPNIYYYFEEKPGVSNARNLGIEKAKGEYIFFLDSDDKYSENVISSVIDFFRSHYDEVDLVTFHETFIENNKVKQGHVRYDVLQQTGIYDLDIYYYALPTNVNICIKNGNNNYFDTSLNYQEDIFFNAQVLLEKNKIGYVAEADYYYYCDEDGLVSKNNSPIYCFESSTSLFEKLFDLCSPAPKFIQALFFHDCVWKFKSTCLWPYHYNDSDLEVAKKRIVNMLEKVSDEVILSYPTLDSYEKNYWLRLKNDNLQCIVTQKGVSIFSGSLKTYSSNCIETVLKRIKVRDGKVTIRAFFKSIAFEYDNNVTAFANVNGKKIQLNLVDCGAGYYKAKEKTNIFYGFELEIEIVEDLEIAFEVFLGDLKVETSFYNSTFIPFTNERNWYLVGEYLVSELKNTIVIKKLTAPEKSLWRKKEIQETNSKVMKKVLKLSRNKIDKAIWLYMDSPTTLLDNGYYQFLHDCKIEDGIDKFYVVTNEEALDIIDPNLADRVVKYGTDYHIKLLSNCKKLIVSYLDEALLNPIKDAKKNIFGGILNADIIYVQHGVLHANLPWYYSKYRCLADKVAISSKYEFNNLTKNYDFCEEDLILSGMPRFDQISVQENSVGKKVLFAPSWRSYLLKKSNVDLNREKFKEKMLDSNYFNGIIEFLTSDNLIQLLKENDIQLVVKLHPEFQKLYLDEFSEVENEYINFYRDGNFIENDFSAFITDFSSMIFDYIYLKVPVLQFVPDYMEFKSGMNHYRKLDFELPVCNLNKDAESLISDLKELVENSFILSNDQLKIYNGFFDFDSNCTENLYLQILKN